MKNGPAVQPTPRAVTTTLGKRAMAKKSLSRSKRTPKPSKPRADFPLFAHQSGQWAKKVKGKLHYFGVWADPKAAEAKWERDKRALLSGEEPAVVYGESLGWAGNAFLERKHLQRERGELSIGQFNDYRKVTAKVVEYFGKPKPLAELKPIDLERYRNSLPDTWSPVTKNNHLRQVRVFFNYLNETEATDRPIKYKLALQDVPKRKIRMHQAGQEEKLFSRDEIKALIRTAKTAAQLSHIYLGINAAYGSADIGRLKTAAIDFENSWLGEIRGKTGVARGCWLWPETVAALRQAIDEKPWNPRYPDLYSLTRNRQPWWQEETDSNPLIASFSRNKKAASITRRGVGQYSLRHTFRTIGGDVGDREAVDFIMGHKDPSVSAGYRHGIDPKRVVAVCSHVRDWLFGDNQGAG